MLFNLNFQFCKYYHHSESWERKAKNAQLHTVNIGNRGDVWCEWGEHEMAISNHRHVYTLTQWFVFHTVFFPSHFFFCPSPLLALFLKLVLFSHINSTSHPITGHLVLFSPLQPLYVLLYFSQAQNLTVPFLPWRSWIFPKASGNW